MGEANRTKLAREVAHGLAQKFADEGKLIEGGWWALRHLAVPPNAPEVQIREMRHAFMAGAQHLFASIMGIMDPSDPREPTEQDLDRLSKIHAELEVWRKTMEAHANSGAKGMPPAP